MSMTPKQIAAPELLPCPFCGHSPYNDEQTAHVFGCRTGNAWAVACSYCEVAAPGAETLSDAITEWNTRVPDPRLADLLTALDAERAKVARLSTVLDAARAVNHDSLHGNGLEGFRKNRDRLRIAIDQLETDHE